jgi:serine/threonine protein phosphatase PrpC
MIGRATEEGDLLSFRSAVGSDTGLERSVNEDSVYASKRLVAVADGMGGRAAGDVASSIAIECLARTDRALSQNPVLLSDLQEAAEKANARLRSAVARNPRLTGMGTTLTAMSLSGERIMLAHIGDSRAYGFRDGRLTQLTLDHTYVQWLVDEGQLPAAEAAEFQDQSTLVRVLNGEKTARPDLSVHNARPGDRFLLCSDGLSGVVDPQDIGATMGWGSPSAVTRQLIELACAQGGPDNITCVVADVIESEQKRFDGSDVVTLGAVSALRPDL